MQTPKPRFSASLRPLAGCLVALATLAACGAEDPPPFQSVQDHPDGYWQDVRFPQGTGILDEESRRKLEQLANVGYATGYEAPRIETGVTIHLEELAQPGLNLYCSGHAPEAVLMDMQGKVLHRWSLPFDQVPSQRTPSMRTQLTWRKVHLLANGDLIVCYEGLGLARLDRNSKLLWYWDGASHHDFEVIGDRVFTLSREGSTLPYLETDQPIVEDAVCQ
ncbi:MAG: hypothetical protein KDB61_07415, partial [Planctomycetes bacterium]|nr:hypothetical protein [Planctomycetota bacterium]